MRSKLMTPAGKLTYTGRGMEDTVGPAGATRDIDYGPRPTDLDIKPHGALAVECTWRCRFSIPVCGDARFKGVREWCYGVSWSMDRNRNTTVLTRGHVIIAGGRSNTGARKVTESADDFREAVTPPLRLGFRRESSDYQLSENRLRLDYTVVDAELGINAPGDGLLDAQASETAASEQFFGKYTRTIEATYTVAPGKSVKVAWDKFSATVRDRLAVIKLSLPNAAVVPLHFQCGDPELYGQNQKVQMRLTFRVAPATMDEALGKMGIWRPVPNSTPADWYDFISTSDLFHSFGPRGRAGLKFRVNDDKVVDLCGGDGPSPGTPDRPQQSPAGGFIGGLRGSLAGLGALPKGVFPRPTPRVSWLHFECFSHVSVDTGTVVGSTLPEEPLAELRTPQTTWDVTKGVMPLATFGQIPRAAVANAQSPSQRPTSTFIHKRTAPTVHVWLRGRAVRYGFGIPQPQLLTVDNCEATLVGAGSAREGFWSGIVGEGEYPICGAGWNLHYVIPGMQLRGTLPNPILGGLVT
jgi:hypothetical protein